MESGRGGGGRAEIDVDPPSTETELKSIYYSAREGSSRALNYPNPSQIAMIAPHGKRRFRLVTQFQITLTLEEIHLNFKHCRNEKVGPGS